MLKWIPLLAANLTRRRLRTGLTMVSVTATFILFGMLESFRHAVTTFADDYANALVVQSRNVPLPYGHVNRLQQMKGVSAACGVLLTYVQLASEKRLLIQAVPDSGLFGAYPGIGLDAAAREVWHRERTAALIDRQLAAENGWKVGDRVVLPGTAKGAVFKRPDGRNALELVIAGIYSTTNSVAATGVFARYEYVRDLLGADRSGLEYVAVRIAQEGDVDIMRELIDKEFQNSAAPTKTYSYRALLRAYYGTFRDLSTLALVVLSISSMTLLLIAGSVLAQAYQERIHEIATLEALGVPRRSLLGMLVGEALLLTAPAAALGLLIAAVLAQRIDAGVDVVANGLLPTHTLVTAAIMVIVLALAIAVVPGLRMMRSSLAESLRRE